MGSSTLFTCIIVLFIVAVKSQGDDKEIRNVEYSQVEGHFNSKVHNNDLSEAENHQEYVLTTCDAANSTYNLSFEKVPADNSLVESSFVTHKLPDGALMQFTLDPASSFRCIPAASPQIAGHGGLRVLEVQRKLIGSGAHREVSTVLMVKLEGQGACDIVVVEKLPSGVFADIFQLEGLVARQVYADAVVYGDHDLERPALHSFPSSVIMRKIIISDSNQLQPQQVEVSLPLHARYPPLSMDSHVLVNLTFPHVLFRCSLGHTKGTSLGHTIRLDKHNISWALLSWRENASALLQWPVPAGNPGQTTFVAVVTACSALAGVVVILAASNRSFLAHKRKAG